MNELKISQIDFPAAALHNFLLHFIDTGCVLNSFVAASPYVRARIKNIYTNLFLLFYKKQIN